MLQVSVCVDKKILMLFNINDPDNRVELSFLGHYGNIVSYRWWCSHSHPDHTLLVAAGLCYLSYFFSFAFSRYGDGYILIGFSHGYLVVISTHIREIGQELYQARNHKDSLNSVAVSPALNKAASCGDNRYACFWISMAGYGFIMCLFFVYLFFFSSIKIHELSEFKDIINVVELEDETKGEMIVFSRETGATLNRFYSSSRFRPAELDRWRAADGGLHTERNASCLPDQAAHPGWQLWHSARLPHLTAGGHGFQPGGRGKESHLPNRLVACYKPFMFMPPPPFI